MASILQDPEPPNQSPEKSARETERSAVCCSVQKLLAISLYVLAAISGALSVFYFENRMIDYSLSIIFAINATIWAVNDSRRRKLTFHPALQMLHLLLCPVSLVVYFIYTRGVRGVGWVAVHMIGLIVLTVVAFSATYWAVYLSGNWQLFDPIYLE